MDKHVISSPNLTAVIQSAGAELCSLRGADGEELLWQAGAVWPRHAPILFPIVGKVKNDRYRVGGVEYSMGQHGFARDSQFRWVEKAPDHCRLRLEDSPETRRQYPFAFRFDVVYTVSGDSLEIAFEIGNPGDVVLPVSAGAHPAFRWPLREGVPRDAHALDFARPETHAIRRLGGDALLDPAPFANPVQGRHLPLRDELFQISAMIFEKIDSRSVRYGAPGTPVIEVNWDGFYQLGVWTRAGGDFLCIEPWHGTTSPADFDGEFADKPDLMLIPPCQSRRLTHGVRVIC